MINSNQNIFSSAEKIIFLYECSSKSLEKILSKSDNGYLFILLNKKEKIIINKYRNVIFFSWSLFENQFEHRSKLSYMALFESEKFLKKYNNININLLKKNNEEKKIKNLFLKKTLSLIFFNYLEIYLILNELSKINNNIEFINFDSDLNIIENIKKKLKNFSYKFVKKNYLKNLFPYFSMSILFLPFYFLLIKKNNKLIKNKFKLGVRVYNSGILTVKKNFNNIDWMITNKLLKKKDVLFIFEDILDLKNRKKFLKKNYFFIELNNKDLNYNIGFFDYVKIFKICSSIFVKLIFKERILIKCYVKMLHFYFKWFLISNKIKINNYIAYQDNSNEHLIRNYFLKLLGIKTIHYKSTFTENIINKGKYINLNNLYSNYDVEHHWGKSSLSFSKNCFSLTKFHKITGPIWIIKNTKFPKKINKIYSFFSTSFGGIYSMNSTLDHLKFLHFIKKLIIKKPDFKYFYKAKCSKYFFNTRLSPHIKKELLSIRKISKNFKIQFSDSDLSTENLILKSDIVFSMPFSSIILESIFLRTRVYICDFGNRYPKNIYRKFSIVFHNAENLMNEIKRIKSNERTINLALNTFRINSIINPQKKIIEDLI